MDITQEVTNLIKSRLARKDFSTGSKGFFAADKITMGGDRFQVQASVQLIGSKDQPKVRVAATVEEMAAGLVAMVQEGFPAKAFKSGKSGYYKQGKVEAHGQRFQASVQAVRLG